MQGKFILASMFAFDVSSYISGRKSVFNTSAQNVDGYMGTTTDRHSVWTGNGEYEFLFNKLTVYAAHSQAQIVTSRTEQNAVAALNTREVISIVGEVSKDGTGLLARLFVAETDSPIPSPSGTGFSIRFHDSLGNELGNSAIHFESACEAIKEGFL